MSEKKKVGILGYGGVLGQGLLGELKERYILRLGQRRTIQSEKDKNWEIQTVDLFQDEQLHRFLEGLDAVVNCAAPSWYSGSRVALAAISQGIPYIDAFGADTIAKDIDGNQGTCIIGTGSFPGFSGILPLYLIEEYKLTQVDCFHMVAFSNEKNSVGAVADLILSSVGGFGRADQFYRNGKFEYAKEMGRLFPGFDSTFKFSEYINSETVRVAQRVKANEAHWVNVRRKVDDKADEIVRNITLKYAYNHDFNALIKEIKNRYLSVHNVKSEEYKIGCYIEGKREKEPISVQCVLSLKNSNYINTEVLAQTLVQVLEEERNIGFRYACEFTNPQEVMKRIKRSPGLIKIVFEAQKIRTDRTFCIQSMDEIEEEL